MNIAIISYWSCPLTRVGVLTSGGMNIYVMNLADYMGKLGHRVDIFTRVHKENDEKVLQIHQNVRIIHLNVVSIKDTDLFAHKILKFREKNSLQYEVIHAHYFYSGIVGLKLKKILSVPCLITFHSLGRTKEEIMGINDAFRIRSEKKIIKKADGIIASTELEKNELMEKYNALRTKIYVVSPGVNHRIFKPLNRIMSRNKLNLPQKLKIILFVGRIDPIKGITLLIEAISNLTKIHKRFTDNFRVLLIGGDIKSNIFWENEEVKKIKNLIAERDLECCIKFIGSRPHLMLPFYYSATDVVVMPSLYESFGLVVLEAMSCGSCVLVSKAGGLKYIIKDRINGRFFGNGNINDLSAVLWEVINNSKETKKLGNKAYLSSQKYCWDKQVKKILKVYQTI